MPRAAQRSPGPQITVRTEGPAPADAISPFKINTGDGFKPATVAEVNRSLAQACVFHPGSVKPGDEEARAAVERVRREPDTRRLLAQLARERRQAQVVAPHVASRATPRERRPRSTSSRRVAASRDGPDSSDPPRRCANPACGKPLGPERTAAARFCNDACRKAGERERKAGKAVDHELIRREALAVKMVEDGEASPELALLALLSVVWWHPVAGALAA